MTADVTAARARPDSLTLAALASLRAALLDELDAHQAQVAELQATVEDLTGQADGDSMLAREMAEAAGARAVEAVAEIDRALGRLDDGAFGTCERCRGPIPLERLTAIPHTRHCVACHGAGPGLLG